MIQEPIRAMLTFIAKVAHAQPMEPHSYEAEQLLHALHAESYLHPCEQCRETPTSPMGEVWLCKPCVDVAKELLQEAIDKTIKEVMPDEK